MERFTKDWRALPRSDPVSTTHPAVTPLDAFLAVIS